MLSRGATFYTLIFCLLSLTAVPRSAFAEAPTRPTAPSKGPDPAALFADLRDKETANTAIEIGRKALILSFAERIEQWERLEQVRNDAAKGPVLSKENPGGATQPDPISGRPPPFTAPGLDPVGTLRAWRQDSKMLREAFNGEMKEYNDLIERAKTNRGLGKGAVSVFDALGAANEVAGKSAGKDGGPAAKAKGFGLMLSAAQKLGRPAAERIFGPDNQIAAQDELAKYASLDGKAIDKEIYRRAQRSPLFRDGVTKPFLEGNSRARIEDSPKELLEKTQAMLRKDQAQARDNGLENAVRRLEIALRANQRQLDALAKGKSAVLTPEERREIMESELRETREAIEQAQKKFRVRKSEGLTNEERFQLELSAWRSASTALGSLVGLGDEKAGRFVSGLGSLATNAIESFHKASRLDNFEGTLLAASTGINAFFGFASLIQGLSGMSPEQAMLKQLSLLRQEVASFRREVGLHFAHIDYLLGEIWTQNHREFSELRQVNGEILRMLESNQDASRRIEKGVNRLANQVRAQAKNDRRERDRETVYNCLRPRSQLEMTDEKFVACVDAFVNCATQRFPIDDPSEDGTFDSSRLATALRAGLESDLPFLVGLFREAGRPTAVDPLRWSTCTNRFLEFAMQHPARYARLYPRPTPIEELLENGKEAASAFGALRRGAQTQAHWEERFSDYVNSLQRVAQLSKERRRDLEKLTQQGKAPHNAGFDVTKSFSAQEMQPVYSTPPKIAPCDDRKKRDGAVDPLKAGPLTMPKHIIDVIPKALMAGHWLGLGKLAFCVEDFHGIELTTNRPEGVPKSGIGVYPVLPKLAARIRITFQPKGDDTAHVIDHVHFRANNIKLRIDRVVYEGTKIANVQEFIDQYGELWNNHVATAGKDVWEPKRAEFWIPPAPPAGWKGSAPSDPVRLWELEGHVDGHLRANRRYFADKLGDELENHTQKFNGPAQALTDSRNKLEAALRGSRRESFADDPILSSHFAGPTALPTASSLGDRYTLAARNYDVDTDWNIDPLVKALTDAPEKSPKAWLEAVNAHPPRFRHFLSPLGMLGVARSVRGRFLDPIGNTAILPKHVASEEVLDRLGKALDRLEALPNSDAVQRAKERIRVEIHITQRMYLVRALEPLASEGLKNKRFREIMKIEDRDAASLQLALSGELEIGEEELLVLRLAALYAQLTTRRPAVGPQDSAFFEVDQSMRLLEQFQALSSRPDFVPPAPAPAPAGTGSPPVPARRDGTPHGGSPPPR